MGIVKVPVSLLGIPENSLGSDWVSSSAGCFPETVVLACFRVLHVEPGAEHDTSSSSFWEGQCPGLKLAWFGGAAVT